MQINLFYFSGTGNCLDIARRLSEKLDNAELTSIPQAMKAGKIQCGEMTGIVSPIYMHNIPHLVVDFIKKLNDVDYLFILFAGGGEPGDCFRTIRKLFKSQRINLSSLFSVTMPSNYAPFGCPSIESQNKDFEKAYARLDEIATIIKSREHYVDRSDTSFIRSKIYPGLLYKIGYKMIKTMDKHFHADENCNSCGICEQVCPVGNIKMVDDKPEWHSNCQQCFACLQWCPQKAIQFGDKTVNVERYHNPNVNVTTIIDSSGA